MDPWKSIAHLSRHDIRELQNKKLQNFINTHVYPFSPYYRRLFDQNKIDPKSIRTADDLKRIPYTSKSDFLNTPEAPEKSKDFILQPTPEKIKASWPKGKLIALQLEKMMRGDAAVKARLGSEYRPIFMTFTTGTTNNPVGFLYSQHDIQNLHLSGGRMLQLFNIAPSDRIVNIFPFAPHLAFWQVFFGGMDQDVFILSTGGGKVLGTMGNLTSLGKMKPAIILGVPSYIYHLIRLAEEQKCDMSFVKKVVLGAGKVTIPFKEKLSDLLHSMGAHEVSVLGTYGFTESRAAWGECPTDIHHSSGYHLYPDKEIFEVIDPDTGEVKKEGEDGELVYTALDARASVVLRYRTGDFVRGGITYEPCPYCGRTVGRISSDITRISDVKDLKISKVKGTLIDFNHFSTVLNEFKNIVEWQVEIRKRNNDAFDVDELVIYLCCKNKNEHAALEEQVRNHLIHATEISPNEVKFIGMEEMIKRLELETANKEKRIIDSRPKG